MKPLRDYLVIVKIAKPTITKAGIHIDTAELDSTSRGRVILTGSTVTADGPAVGDEVLFHDGQGIKIEDGQILIREGELALIY